jgi:TolB protein
MMMLRDTGAVRYLILMGLTGLVPSSAWSLDWKSRLEVISIKTGQREIVYETSDHIEAPNWSRDGKTFLFNSGGRLYTLPRRGGQPQLLETGNATHCNNDHGFSPDGRSLVISDQPAGESLIYTLPASGGAPRQVTARGPSYWHGWSPDGKTIPPRKSGSRPRPAWTTDPTTRRTAARSTSTPSAPATCASGR